MLSFAQRKGLKPIRTLIQKDEADIALRNRLWNCITDIYFNRVENYVNADTSQTTLLKQFWTEYYELRSDEIDRLSYTTINKIKQDFLESDWMIMYDILEFFPNHYPYPAYNVQFIEKSNIVLEKYLSAYRFVGYLIVDITSEQELESIELALQNTSKYKPVQNHLNRSIELYSDRESPDYRNSIKEAVSAIESFCCIITGKPKATLGQALSEIEKSYDLHAALKSSFSSLYGWTSDASGIRHKLLDKSTLGQEDARFMLVSCSAFINYLMVKVGK